jgi:hypothetical protein
MLERRGPKGRLPGDGLALGREHRVQQTGEAVIEIVAAQRKHAPATVGAGAYDTGLAQDAEVVREGRLREREVEGATRAFVALGQAADDREPGRVAQSVEYVGELKLPRGWMMRFAHSSERPTLVTAFDEGRTFALVALSGGSGADR